MGIRNAFKAKASNDNSTTKLGIALQGGGSYGAYAKGVLKALFNSKAINDPSLEIKAVTGTSAGAVNGALVTYGLNTGGTKEAVKLLDEFWNNVADNGRMLAMWSAFDPLPAKWPNLPPSVKTASALLPKGFVIKELKSLIEKHVVDWEAVKNGPVKLFVNAVKEDPETKNRSHVVFKGESLSADAITASGALEDLGGHTIDGVTYYDGAYWRNPCMTDIQKEDISDLLIITLQKEPDSTIQAEHQDKARDKMTDPGRELLTSEIHNHIAHMHEANPSLNLHVISLSVDERWDDSSRMNTDPKWLATLEQMGYEDGQKWLRKNAKHLGKQSSYEPPAAESARGPSPKR